ncbi:hypothetical protein [Caballeronia sp. LZ035]|nr:hypothetical protein [Caballeronia sp. LZ035]MDR5759512.1 hypothetical protein [Caballeronia sp. LZ035]
MKVMKLTRLPSMTRPYRHRGNQQPRVEAMASSSAGMPGMRA